MTIPQLHQLFLDSNGVTTDTRKITKNTLFFALKGDNFNGNTYATQAIQKGATHAIVDEPTHATSAQHILVSDVLTTLQELAIYHRQFLNIPIIALTGSNGKTTTKELINVVLSTQYATTATVGNLNNHIGVPLTLLSMTNATEIGIVEMGANHIGEIENLCSITQPDYGYITNIGKAHLEGFGSIEGVLQGKTELYQHLKQHNKLVFLNTDDDTLTQAATTIKSYTFSTQSKSDVMITLEKAAPMVTVSFEKETINTQLIGTYNFTNIAAAIAIGSYFKIDFEKTKQAISNYSPTNNRSQIITKNDTMIILDAYNANPSSMTAALQNFDQLVYSNKAIFLGDMFELGTTAIAEHQHIANLALQTSATSIHLIGAHFYAIESTDSRVYKYSSFDDFLKQWNPKQQSNAILIKGSRGMKMERILELL